MYNEQLEKLIEMALMDGELTEKEKQILFKKAESFGVDLDEFEMVLDARLFEKQQNITVVKQEVVVIVPQEKIEKLSPIRALLKQLDEDEERRREILRLELEKRRIERNQFNAKNVSKFAKNVIGSSIPGYGLAKELLGSDDSETNEDDILIIETEEKIIEKKKYIISNFIVPTSKDDILEFLSIAVPNAKKQGNFLSNNTSNDTHNALSQIWRQKCEQIIIKAKTLYINDQDILNYDNELTASKSSKIGTFFNSLKNI